MLAPLLIAPAGDQWQSTATPVAIPTTNGSSTSQRLRRSGMTAGLLEFIRERYSLSVGVRVMAPSTRAAALALV